MPVGVALKKKKVREVDSALPDSAEGGEWEER